MSGVLLPVLGVPDDLLIVMADSDRTTRLELLRNEEDRPAEWSVLGVRGIRSVCI